MLQQNREDIRLIFISELNVDPFHSQNISDEWYQWKWHLLNPLIYQYNNTIINKINVIAIKSYTYIEI